MSKKQTLEHYYRDIAGIRMITPEEEIDLAKRIRKNDQAALEKLVCSNLRFVVSVAKSYQNHGLAMEDLINEGNLGLVRAAHRFDETRGFKFISYAVWWIRQAMLQAIAEKTRLIRLPLNQISTLTRIGKVYSRLEQIHERSPTNDEIAVLLDTPSDDVANIIGKSSHAVSLDSTILSETNSRLMDVVANREEVQPDSALIDESLKIEVLHLLRVLTRRESQIIKLYYGLNDQKAKTLEEVGIEFKLTRERIRQIKERALQKLRKSSASRDLVQYL